MQKFRDLIENAAFIEHAEFSGNCYGTSFETVRHIQQAGRRCILDIEAEVCTDPQQFLISHQLLMQGIRQVKATSLDPVYLFISPPSMTALRARLQGRGTDSEASMQKRLATAVKEIEYARQPNVHDVIIVNDDVDRAYGVFKKVALGEKVEGDKLPELDD